MFARTLMSNRSDRFLARYQHRHSTPPVIPPRSQSGKNSVITRSLTGACSSKGVRVVALRIHRAIPPMRPRVTTRKGWQVPPRWPEAAPVAVQLGWLAPPREWIASASQPPSAREQSPELDLSAPAPEPGAGHSRRPPERE